MYREVFEVTFLPAPSNHYHSLFISPNHESYTFLFPPPQDPLIILDRILGPVREQALPPPDELPNFSQLRPPQIFGTNNHSQPIRLHRKPGEQLDQPTVSLASDAPLSIPSEASQKELSDIT